MDLVSMGDMCMLILQGEINQRSEKFKRKISEKISEPPMRLGVQLKWDRVINQRKRPEGGKETRNVFISNGLESNVVMFCQYEIQLFHTRGIILTAFDIIRTYFPFFPAITKNGDSYVNFLFSVFLEASVFNSKGYFTTTL